MQSVKALVGLRSSFRRVSFLSISQQRGFSAQANYAQNDDLQEQVILSLLPHSLVTYLCLYLL